MAFANKLRHLLQPGCFIFLVKMSQIDSLLSFLLFLYVSLFHDISSQKWMAIPNHLSLIIILLVGTLIKVQMIQNARTVRIHWFLVGKKRGRCFDAFAHRDQAAVAGA